MPYPRVCPQWHGSSLCTHCSCNSTLRYSLHPNSPSATLDLHHLPLLTHMSPCPAISPHLFSLQANTPPAASCGPRTKVKRGPQQRPQLQAKPLATASTYLLYQGLLLPCCSPPYHGTGTPSLCEWASVVGRVGGCAVAVSVAAAGTQQLVC
jgi:hypothetical protein